MKPFIFGLTLLFGVFLPLSLQAVEPVKPVPRCAILDPDKLDRVAILEAKLSADPAAIWVERNAIEQVLKEQQVQALFSANGVGQRAKLGRLLKADVLVMVRRVKDAKEPSNEVVISETSGGLRLLVRGVPESKNAGYDVEALRAVVTDGLKKFGETAKEVVAVPPFLSNNLTFENDYLKGALGKLVEQVALTQPGVVAVELAEAEALAKELALAVEGTISRPLPVYLLGEFRHDGRGMEQTITVKLRAERGGKLIGKPAELKVKPEAAVGELQKWTAEILSVVAGDMKPRLPTDPKAEAKTLADRARDFARLGQWAESLALNEASLLLDAEPVKVRAAAVTAITYVLRGLENVPPQNFTPEFYRSLQRLHRRAWAHLEAVLLRDDRFGEYFLTMSTPAFGFLSTTHHMRPRTGSNKTAVEQPILQEAFEERRDATLRLLPKLVKGRSGAELHYVGTLVSDLPMNERYKLVEQIIVLLQDAPGAKDRTVGYINYARIGRSEALGRYQQEHRPANGRRDPVSEAAGTAAVWAAEEAALSALLDRLAASKNSELQAASAAMKRLMADELVPVKAELSEPVGLRLGPVNFVLEADQTPVRRVLGILAIAPDIDVVWGGNLYLMKQKGKLRPVHSLRRDLNNDVFTDVRYDGKYVWASALRGNAAPLLLVLDPKSEKVWEVTGADGLPQPSDEQIQSGRIQPILLTPIEPGRACIAASFGERTWVGIATFDPVKEKAEVKIVHEAREAEDVSNPKPNPRTTINFQPTFMSAISKAGPDGKVERRVFIGRGTRKLRNGSQPLVLDPDRQTVSLLKDQLNALADSGATNMVATTNEAIYFLESAGFSPSTTQLIRVGLPDLAKKSVGKAMPEGSSLAAVVHNGRFYFNRWQVEQPPKDKPVPPGGYLLKTSSELWAVDLEGKEARRLGANLPQVNVLSISSHYGLVAFIMDKRYQNEFRTIDFTDPPKK